jgi:hypothetical protein
MDHSIQECTAIFAVEHGAFLEITTSAVISRSRYFKRFIIRFHLHRIGLSIVQQRVMPVGRCRKRNQLIRDRRSIPPSAPQLPPSRNPPHRSHHLLQSALLPLPLVQTQLILRRLKLPQHIGFALHHHGMKQSGRRGLDTGLGFDNTAGFIAPVGLGMM